MSRTQLRLQQLTGSIADLAYSGSNSSATANGSLVLNDLGAVLGEFAGAIGRISGKTSDFTNQSAGILSHASLGLGTNGTEFQINDSSGDITFDNTTSDKDIIFTVNDGGSTDTEVFRVDGDVSALLMASGKEIHLGGSSTKISGDNSTITVTGNSTFANNVTITGNLDVNGTTTTIDASNTSITDSLIVLNSASDGSPAGSRDVGIIFARADVSRAIYVDDSDEKFHFVTTYTSGSASTITDVANAEIVAGTATFSGLTNNRVVIAGTGGVLEDDGNFTFDGADLALGANIGLTFDSNGSEKIESDDTDLTISSGAKINLTATSDVVIPANVGLILDGSGDEKIESDGTDISFSVGAGGDINIPPAIGLTFGNDGEKIEGDGTDLTISSSDKLNLTATSDVYIPQGVGLVFDTAGTENIESDGTDLTIASGNDVLLDISSAASDSLQLIGTSENLVLTPDNGSAQSVVSSSVGDLLLGANADNFIFQGSLLSNAFQISVPSTAGSGVQLSSGDAEGLALSGSRGISFSEDNMVDSNYTGTFGFMKLANNSTEYDTFVTNFSNNKSIIGAINENATAASAIAATKRVMYLDAAVSAGASLDPNTVTVSNTAPSSRAALNLSAVGDADGLTKVDVYVNGQLLTSGSSANVGATPPTADYEFDVGLSSAATLVFGFDLEVDDVVTVIRKI